MLNSQFKPKHPFHRISANNAEPDQTPQNMAYQWSGSSLFVQENTY